MLTNAVRTACLGTGVDVGAMEATGGCYPRQRERVTRTLEMAVSQASTRQGARLRGDGLGRWPAVPRLRVRGGHEPCGYRGGWQYKSKLSRRRSAFASAAAVRYALSSQSNRAQQRPSRDVLHSRKAAALVSCGPVRSHRCSCECRCSANGRGCRQGRWEWVDARPTFTFQIGFIDIVSAQM